CARVVNYEDDDDYYPASLDVW
nr:immunoglobulin heavy chain junction region [Macaca mulatta]MOY21774.1 immunoglobulin heavy chain junction region [Macaca mulatta]MOY21805.1 immunoglobulin heavy chain junction region [Macaca mulatta]MOY21845.1 immunoglobulin heavy chain junction region [Macaca mulatta]MOY22053.1 immunoglobulin heavy chain junction region [Macaca mulatta]